MSENLVYFMTNFEVEKWGRHVISLTVFIDAQLLVGFIFEGIKMCFHFELMEKDVLSYQN